MEKVKGYDGRISGAYSFCVFDTGEYSSSIKCEGLPLVDIFGPTYFVGKDQNIRSRFTSPKQESAFLAECFKAVDIVSHPAIDSIPISSLGLSSDMEYKLQVKKFLTSRIEKFSDEQVSAALKITIGPKWLKQFQAILETVNATKVVEPVETAAKKSSYTRLYTSAATTDSTVGAVEPVVKKRNFARFNKPAGPVGGAGAS